MNEIKGMELVYESLVPIENPDDTFLSVGTVTLSSNQYIHLDVNITHSSWRHTTDSFVEFHTLLTEFEPRTFAEEYEEMGFHASDMDYDFFASRLLDTYVTEVYTEYVANRAKQYLPLTLKKVWLQFTDDRCLDYSDRISIFALAELAEVA